MLTVILGCSFPDTWKGEKCMKPLSTKKNKFLLTTAFAEFSNKVMYTPRTGKCKTISCENDPTSWVKAPKCNCDVKGVCNWTKQPKC